MRGAKPSRSLSFGLVCILLYMHYVVRGLFDMISLADQSLAIQPLNAEQTPRLAPHAEFGRQR